MKQADENTQHDAAGQAFNYAKRFVIIVFGFTLLLIGIAMIFLPGPSIIVIPLALAILGTEFVWARMLLRKFKQKTGQLRDMMRQAPKKEEG